MRVDSIGVDFSGAFLWSTSCELFPILAEQSGRDSNNNVISGQIQAVDMRLRELTAMPSLSGAMELCSFLA
jgi:hypothetical protein